MPPGLAVGQRPPVIPSERSEVSCHPERAQRVEGSAPLVHRAPSVARLRRFQGMLCADSPQERRVSADDADWADARSTATAVWGPPGRSLLADPQCFCSCIRSIRVIRLDPPFLMPGEESIAEGADPSTLRSLGMTAGADPSTRCARSG